VIAAAAPSLLAALQDYYTEHAVLPSYATIGGITGIRAKSWVHKIVSDLRDEGFLDFTPDKRLKPGRRFFERVLAERVRAGGPE
jgi:repressor LexA